MTRADDSAYAVVTPVPFRAELGLCRELALLRFAAVGLLGLAAVAGHAGDVERAARLAGAAKSNRYGQPADAVQARVAATFLDPAQHQAGPATWTRAHEEGRRMTFHSAIAHALREAGPEEWSTVRPGAY